jgi:hypothetical protein
MVHMAGQRHPVTGIVYDVKGNPIFDPVAVFDARLSSDVALLGKARMHKIESTKQLAATLEGNPALKAKFNEAQLSDITKGKESINGYIWHHHQDIGRMQLIPRKTHVETGHIGESLWTRGLDNAK